MRRTFSSILLSMLGALTTACFDKNAPSVPSPIDAQALLPSVECIRIETLDGKSGKTCDKNKIEELKTYFEGFTKTHFLVKVTYKYKLTLAAKEKEFSLRVTDAGMLLRDVPASEIQTGYQPDKPGIASLLDRVLASSR